METYSIKKVKGQEQWEIWCKQDEPYPDRWCVQCNIESKKLAIKLKEVYQRNGNKRFTVEISTQSSHGYGTSFGIIDKFNSVYGAIINCDTYELAKDLADTYESHYNITGE